MRREILVPHSSALVVAFTSVRVWVGSQTQNAMMSDLMSGEDIYCRETKFPAKLSTGLVRGPGTRSLMVPSEIKQ